MTSLHLFQPHVLLMSNHPCSHEREEKVIMNLDLRTLLRTIEEKVIMNGARFLHHLLGVPLFSTSRHRRCSPSSFLAHSIFLYTFWNTNLTTFTCVRFQTMKPLQVCISYKKLFDVRSAIWKFLESLISCSMFSHLVLGLCRQVIMYLQPFFYN